jgi:hypothetical protein
MKWAALWGVSAQREDVMAVEPEPGAYEPEWRYEFEAAGPSGPHVVVSGIAVVAQLLTGTSDDNWEEYEVYLTVGPYWRDVQSVVPSVTVNGFWNENADQDDQQGWALDRLTWDAVSGTDQYVDEERIRLKFFVGLLGENSYIFYLGYNLFARGRELGHEGLSSPQPVWPLVGGA